MDPKVIKLLEAGDRLSRAAELVCQSAIKNPNDFDLTAMDLALCIYKVRASAVSGNAYAACGCSLLDAIEADDLGDWLGREVFTGACPDNSPVCYLCKRGEAGPDGLCGDCGFGAEAG